MLTLEETSTETAHPSQVAQQPLVWVILQQEAPVRNMELTSHHQLEELGKSQKETPVLMSYQPSRIFLAGIYLGWGMLRPSGMTLCQNDWPETTRKLIPALKHPRRSAMWQSSPPGFPCLPVLQPGAPFQ